VVRIPSWAFPGYRGMLVVVGIVALWGSIAEA
jgi:hypothetical protein